MTASVVRYGLHLYIWPHTCPIPTRARAICAAPPVLVARIYDEDES